MQRYGGVARAGGGGFAAEVKRVGGVVGGLAVVDDELFVEGLFAVVDEGDGGFAGYLG